MPAGRGARHRAVCRARRRGRRAAHRIRKTGSRFRHLDPRGAASRSGPHRRQRAASGHRIAGAAVSHTRIPTTCWRTATKDSVPALMVALDNISDPRNLGAIVRSVAAFGGHGVVIPQRRSASVTAVAWRTSAGAAARVPVARATNLNRTLKDWADAGVQVVGLDAGGDTTIDESRRRGADGRGGRLRGQGAVAAGAGELRRRGVDPDGRADGVVERFGGRRRGAGRNRPPATGLTVSARRRKSPQGVSGPFCVPQLARGPNSCRLNQPRLGRVKVNLSTGITSPNGPLTA